MERVRITDFSLAHAADDASNVAVLKRVVEDTPRPIHEINPDWLCALIARLQAKAPAHRPGSATEVAMVLAQRLAELPQPTDLVGDFKPPNGMPLVCVNLWGTNVDDLSLLAGMSLRELNVSGA